MPQQRKTSLHSCETFFLEQKSCSQWCATSPNQIDHIINPDSTLPEMHYWFESPFSPYITTVWWWAPASFSSIHHTESTYSKALYHASSTFLLKNLNILIPCISAPPIVSHNLQPINLSLPIYLITPLRNLDSSITCQYSLQLFDL